MDKIYKNNDTGKYFTEKEIKTLCNQFYFETGHESPEKYFNYMLENDMISEIVEFTIADYDTFTMIEKTNNYNSALEIIKEFEKQDKAENIFTPDFYCIIDNDNNLIDL